MPLQPTLQHRSIFLDTTTRFISVYALLSLSRGPRFLLTPNRAIAKIALFPAFLPLIFRSLRRKCQYLRVSETLAQTHPSLNLSSAQFAAILSSPLLILLPSGLRLYIAIYAFTSAIRTFLRAPPTNSLQPIEQANDITPQSNNWRDHVPPIWLLNVVGNTIMLPLWLMGPEGTLPNSYEQVIFGASQSYFSRKPTELAPLGIKHLLSHSSFPASSDTSTYAHAYEVCQALHPLEPSCVATYINALFSESLATVKWVAMFESLGVALKNRARLFDPSAFPSLVGDVIDGTIRGTLFVVGSINTSWAATCLLQRLLPDGSITRSRFLINGALGSLWILILHPTRRAEISLYVFRVTLVNLCNLYIKRKGRKGVGRAEVGLFALSWTVLLALKDRGYRLEGMTARAMKLLESS